MSLLWGFSFFAVRYYKHAAPLEPRWGWQMRGASLIQWHAPGTIPSRPAGRGQGYWPIMSIGTSAQTARLPGVSPNALPGNEKKSPHIRDERGELSLKPGLALHQQRRA